MLPDSSLLPAFGPGAWFQYLTGGGGAGGGGGGGGLGRRVGEWAGGCCSCVKTLCECIRHRQYVLSARARGQLGESGELLSAAATSSFVTLRQTSEWQLYIMHEVMAR